MARPERRPLWRQVVGEVFWGRRGLVKVASVWLPLAVFGSLDDLGGRAKSSSVCLLILASVACWALGSILVNDLADRKADQAAGKHRWILRLPLWAGAFTVALLFALGALGPLTAGPAAASAYAGAVALGLSYSIGPLRLKTRGLWGPLAYSASGALAFVAVPWAWVGAGWRPLAVLAPAVFMDKWVNLYFHQVIDRDADRAAGTPTHSVVVGAERARGLLRGTTAAACVWLVGTVAFVALSLSSWRLAVAASTTVVVAAAALYGWRARRGPGEASALVRELPGTYLGLTFALFRAMPLVLLVRLALAEPPMWIVAGVAGLVLLIESWHSFRYRYE